MNNDGDSLNKIASEIKGVSKHETYTTKDIYDKMIYPILQAAARDGQFHYTISRWEFTNLLSGQSNILDVLRYISEEKNIRTYDYGDTISFFW